MESSSSSNLENVMNRFSDHTYRNWYNRSGLSSNLEKENGNPLQYSLFFFFPTPVILPGESHGQRSLKGSVHGVTRVGHDLVSLELYFYKEILQVTLMTSQV